MLSLRTLAYSSAAPTVSGPVQCLAVYQKAINFVTADQRLLTLHCYPYGTSPMGWLLRDRDFVRIRAEIVPRARLHLNEIRLSGCGVEIRRQVYPLHLHLSASVEPLQSQRLQALLRRCPEATGLYGPLNQAAAVPLMKQLRQAGQLFTSALYGEQVDLLPLLGLGLGPGLTPSSDDLLIGMLVAAFSYQASARQLHLLPAQLDYGRLQQFTTQVSATCLRYACQGYFSTPLLRVIHHLRQRRCQLSTIQRFLQHGHTSGADTLLGVWLGAVLCEHQTEYFPQ